MISIVIPTYQEERYIEATLKNLKSLNKKNFEIIISDSGSPDRTVEIAKRYADKVVILPKGRKRSIGQGRNDGARAARGEYVVFIDADVTIPDPPRFFETALRAFAGNQRLVGITAKIRVLPQNSRLSDKVIFTILDVYFGLLNNVFNIGIAAGEFQMIKTAVFRSVGGFNEELGGAEDVDLFYRISRIGRVRTLFGLTVYHTGRRFHKVGWAHTVFLWIKNALSLWFFKKTSSKTWETIR